MTPFHLLLLLLLLLKRSFSSSAAFLRSLPAVVVSLGVEVDRVVPLPFALGSALALLLGVQHHVGESHEHLCEDVWTEVNLRLDLNHQPVCQQNTLNLNADVCAFRWTANEPKYSDHRFSCQNILNLTYLEI